jgi:hypothetical protein
MRATRQHRPRATSEVSSYLNLATPYSRANLTGSIAKVGFRRIPGLRHRARDSDPAFGSLPSGGLGGTGSEARTATPGVAGPEAGCRIVDDFT